MQAACETELARIVSGLPHDEYLKTCGRFQMIEMLSTLLDTIDQQARLTDEHSRTPDPRDTNRTALTFYGSGWWDRLLHPNGTG